MKVTFYLARPDSSSTAIIAAIRHKNDRTNYGTGLSIDPTFWNKETQTVKQSRSFPMNAEYNRTLHKFKDTVTDIFLRYQNENGQAAPSSKILKNLLDNHFHRAEEGKSNVTTIRFIDFFKKIISVSADGTRVNPSNGKPINSNTIKTYKTTLNHLLVFQEKYKFQLSFDVIDLSFYEAYTRYLIKDCNFQSNTVGKHIQVIKLVMNEASEEGLHYNFIFRSRRFSVTREQTSAVALSEQEIDILASYDLSHSSRLEKTRDLFVLGCLTGLRYSDYSHIQPTQIDGDYINILQQKTGEAIVIPIHRIVRALISKYAGVLPKAASNQKMNEYLKELCSIIPIFNVPVTMTFTKGGKKIINEGKKWQFITTHTARRSFATNEVKRGVPITYIMNITGHRTEKAFRTYVRIPKADSAKLMLEEWNSRI